jgi:hypothetical protein
MDDTTKIIRDSKTADYGFQWRVVFEDGTYQLQRLSKEYKTWIGVKHSLDENEVIKMYDRLGE